MNLKEAVRIYRICPYREKTGKNKGCEIYPLKRIVFSEYEHDYPICEILKIVEETK